MLIFYCYVSLPECRGVYLLESYHGKKKSCDLAKPTQLPYVSSIDLTRIQVNQSVLIFQDVFLTAPCCPYPNLQGYEYWHWMSQELSIKKISNNLYIHTRVNIPKVFHIAPDEWWLEDLQLRGCKPRVFWRKSALVTQQSPESMTKSYTILISKLSQIFNVYSLAKWKKIFHQPI